MGDCQEDGGGPQGEDRPPRPRDRNDASGRKDADQGQSEEEGAAVPVDMGQRDDKQVDGDHGRQQDRQGFATGSGQAEHRQAA